MSSTFDPAHLDPDDGLGRRVASTKVRALVRRGNAPITCFYPDDDQKISVDRLPDDHLAIVAGIADHYYKHDHPESPRNFYGWARVTQEQAGDGDRKVEASPLPSNKYHADIALPSIAATDPEEVKRHATELAANAIWRDPA